MGDFFKGWRRKTGLALLAMAMPLTMAWLRSYSNTEGVSISLGIRCDTIDSFDGTISWERTNPKSNTASIKPYSTAIARTGPIARRADIDLNRRWKWMGFEFGATTYHEPWSQSYFEFWVVPYWSLVLPPALLAAYLLLTKPRSAKPPVSNPGATKTGD